MLTALRTSPIFLSRSLPHGTYTGFVLGPKKTIFQPEHISLIKIAGTCTHQRFVFAY
jgi:hypothetical protein